MSALQKIKETIGTYDELNAFSKTRIFNSTQTRFLDLGLNRSDLVGPVMYHIKKAPENATFEEWLDYYFSNVHSAEKALEWSKKFQEAYACNEDFAIKVWVTRILLQTYRGFDNEKKVKALLTEAVHKKNGTDWTVEEVEDKIDRNYAVDLVIKNPEGKIITGIQVKPTSYFLGRKTYNTYERETLNPIKNKTFHEKFGAPVYYVKIEEALEGNLNYIHYNEMKAI